jgi:hypothetical protein
MDGATNEGGYIMILQHITQAGGQAGGSPHIILLHSCYIVCCTLV